MDACYSGPRDVILRLKSDRLQQEEAYRPIADRESALLDRRAIRRLASIHQNVLR